MFICSDKVHHKQKEHAFKSDSSSGNSLGMLHLSSLSFWKVFGNALSEKKEYCIPLFSLHIFTFTFTYFFLVLVSVTQFLFAVLFNLPGFPLFLQFVILYFNKKVGHDCPIHQSAVDSCYDSHVSVSHTFSHSLSIFFN